MDEQRHGIVDHWLQPVRDITEDEMERYSRTGDVEGYLNRLCELSIKAQVANLARTPIIQHALKNGKKLSIHAWVYGLSDGLIRDLDYTVSGCCCH